MDSDHSMSRDTPQHDVCQQRCIHPEHAMEVRRRRLPVTQAHSLSSFFAVLSDPTRLQVLYALLYAQTGELCVCDLAAGLGRDDTTISHQLRVLRNQRIVSMRKVGRVVYYRLIDEHIRQVLTPGFTHTSEVPVHAETEVSA